MEDRDFGEEDGGGKANRQWLVAVISGWPVAGHGNMLQAAACRVLVTVAAIIFMAAAWPGWPWPSWPVAAMARPWLLTMDGWS